MHGLDDHIDNELTALIKELISAGFVFAGGAPFDAALRVPEEEKLKEDT